MDIYEAIKIRRSVRKYKPDPIPENILKRILEAVRLVPSANNSQKYKLVLLKDQKKKEAIAKFAGQEFIAKAPVLIIAVSLDPEYIMGGDVLSYPVDIAIVLDHLTLVAASEGLGTCWIGDFSQEETKKILGIPERYKIAALMPLGFPDNGFSEPGSKTRKSAKELFSVDKFY